MATLKDVARLACVDVSTVSRALNNTSYVHPDTKARIYAAVKELSYQPNVLAQGLRMGKRHTIGVVVPRLHLAIFAEITQGIEEEARKKGYAILVCSTEDDPKVERECLNRLRNGFVDGIILAATGKNSRLVRDIQSSGLPIVQVIRGQERNIPSVVADYHACGSDAVEVLAARGCKNIGFISGNLELEPYRGRYYGYENAVRKLGLPEITCTSDYPCNSFEYGYDCANRLLEEHPQLDGILAAVDVQGLGAIRAAKEHGLRIPEDIKIISLTGHAVGGMLETSMASMELPSHEIGARCTKLILEQIESENPGSMTPQHITYPASFVERESI